MNREKARSTYGLGRIFVRRHGRAPAPGQPDKRTAHWWVAFHVNGQEQREPAKPNTERGALALLKQRLGDVANGTHVGRSAERVTFETLVGLLSADYTTKGRRTLTRALQCVENLRPHFGNLKAVQVTRARVRAYVAERLKGDPDARPPVPAAARNTVQNELNVLNRMLALAVEDELLATAPRFKGPVTEPLKAAQTKPYAEKELARVLAVLERGAKSAPGRPGLKPQPALAAAVRFGSWCGWRFASDVLSLRWSDVDWESGIVQRPSRGTSKALTTLNWTMDDVPEVRALFEQRRDVTKALERATSRVVPLVFTREDGSPIKDYRRALAGACAACGLAGRRRIAHALRPTAARRWRTRGLSDRDIAESVGWDTPKMVELYLGKDPAGVAERRSAAAARWTRTKSGRFEDAAEAEAK
jgi:integrase